MQRTVFLFPVCARRPSRERDCVRSLVDRGHAKLIVDSSAGLFDDKMSNGGGGQMCAM